MFNKAAPKFVIQWVGIVINKTIKAVTNEGGETGIENKNAPSMKSSWSAIGRLLPGERFILRLMQDSIRSPVTAPKDIINPRSMLY